MLVSNGQITKTPVFPGATSDWFYNYERHRSLGTYGELYKCQTWVYVLVSKRARSLARLPLKIYVRDDLNRPEAPKTNPYRALLNNPNPAVPPFRFWEWTSSTYDVYGEAMWFKRRDAGGRPYQLVPLHPTGMQWNDREGRWDFDNGKVHAEGIKPEDIVHFRAYNPDGALGSGSRGLSPLEPLRSTLEHEAAAKAATSAFWRNSARPAFGLMHPANLSEPAQTRLRAQFDGLYGGVENTGRTMIFEEGMEPKALSITAKDSQYIDSRRLNREEVCAVYDMPPPAVQILDRATYSNITEQMRSLYRDTMGSILAAFESDLDSQLRAPDFSDDVYAEFLLDGVLRGDFEQRADAYSKADYMTIAEKRKSENLPYIEGTDVILVNTASLPLDRLFEPGPVDAGTPGRQGIQNPTNAGAPALPAPAEPAKTIVVPSVRLDDVRSVMGRLGRAKSVDEIDEDALVSGVEAAFAGTVIRELTRASSVPELRERLKMLTREEVAQ